MALGFSLACAAASAPARAAEFSTLKGHGGPIMDITVSADTGIVATASFDNAVGIWTGRDPEWLDGHEAAVKTIRFLGQTKAVSGADDNKLILWDLETGQNTKLEGHTAKIMGLAVSPESGLIASASWDAKVGLWNVEDLTPVFLSGHSAGVNQVAFSMDGAWLYSASVDGSIIEWDVAARAEKRVVDRNGFGINVLVLGGEDFGSIPWIAYGTQDGVTRVIDRYSGARLHEFTMERRPILAMALSPDGKKLATGDGHGYITVYDTRTWSIETDFKAALKGPIWALAFSKDNAVLHAGGIENIVYSWPVDGLSKFDPMATKTPDFLKLPETMSNGERQFARKCSVCHTLTADSGRKAGPTLYQVFGRKAGALPGYSYSETLIRSDIIWSEDTINQLFLDGPDHYIPGSKMPMQRIVEPKDRTDLIDYLKAAAMPNTSSGDLE
ncbi:c-type cytochrome [Roseibium denhamense]|nr:c-type cytochrome [Roseibium denhamense]